MGSRSTATPPANSLPPTDLQIVPGSALDIASMILVGIAILVAIADAIYNPLSARLGQCLPKIQRLSSLSLYDQIPCHKCQYFSHNLYLNCALHPVVVLTEGAVDCRDYALKNHDRAE